MRTQSPWSSIAGAVLLLGFAAWNFQHAHAPPDTTPLHPVEGSLTGVDTTWVHHSAKGGGWNAPVVTLSLQDAQSIRFTGHAQSETDAASPLMSLPKGVSVHAQVDATGDMWELAVDGNEAIPMADTLRRHHDLVRQRDLMGGLILLFAAGLGASGVVRLRSM